MAFFLSLRSSSIHSLRRIVSVLALSLVGPSLLAQARTAVPERATTSPETATPLAAPDVPENTPVVEGYTVDPSHYTIGNFGRIDENGNPQTLLQLRTAQSTFDSAATPGHGAIRFISPGRENPFMEMGWYEWGAGIFTQNLFEFWTNGVSVRNLFGSEPSFLAVRDPLDVNDIRMWHDGTNGHINTTGTAPGGIVVEANGPLELHALAGDATLSSSAAVTVDGTGPVSIDSADAASLSADGNVDVESRGGNVSIVSAGRISIDGASPVSVEGTGGVTLEAATGEALVKGVAGVTLLSTVGPVAVQSGLDDVTLSGADDVALSAADDVTVAATDHVAVTGNTVTVGAADVAVTATGGVNVVAGGEVTIKSGAAEPVRVDGTGSLHVPGQLFVGGQEVTPGSGSDPSIVGFTMVPHSAAYYGTIGGSGASWLVDASDVYTYGYSKVGNMVTVSLVIALSSVAGSPVVLTAEIPGGYRAAAQIESFCNISDNHTTYAMMPCLVAAGERVIRFYRPSYSGNWPSSTNRTSVRGTLTFPVLP